VEEGWRYIQLDLSVLGVKVGVANFGR